MNKLCTVPSYLADMCIPVSAIYGRAHLRSAVHCDLVVPRTRLARYGPRGFFISGPVTWNSLSRDLRDTYQSAPSFLSQLKTELFIRAYYITSQHLRDNYCKRGRTLTVLIVLYCIVYTFTMPLAPKRSHVPALLTSAAFDTVDRNILISPLSSWFAIHGSLTGSNPTNGQWRCECVSRTFRAICNDVPLLSLVRTSRFCSWSFTLHEVYYPSRYPYFHLCR